MSSEDISQKKSSETVFKMSERNYIELINNMFNGVAVYKPADKCEDFIILDFNPAAEKIDNISREKVIGRRLTEIFPSAKEFGILDTLKRVNKTGVPEKIPVKKYSDSRIIGWREYHIYKLHTGELMSVFVDVTSQKKTEEALYNNQAELESIINNIPAHILYKDIAGKTKKVNHALARSNGVYPYEMIGKMLSELFDEKFVEKCQCFDEEVLNTGQPKHHIIDEYPCAGGSKWLHTDKIPIKDETGIINGILDISIDISDIINEKTLVENNEKQFRTLVNNLPDLIFSLDENFIIKSCHMAPEVSEIINLCDEDLISKNMLDYIFEPDRDMTINSIIKPRVNKRFMTREQQFRFITGNGDLRWMEMNSMSMYDSDGKLVVTNGILRDIEDRKRIEEELKFFYTIDPLTGLYNRRMAVEMIEKQINVSKRNKTFLSVCFIDINDLKLANDNYGHSEGDFLIKTAADILKTCTRDSDYIFRMGGDEFVILFPGCDDSQTHIIWKRFENEIQVKNSEINKPYKISLSYGFTSVDHTKKFKAEELISQSDKKMYEYKRKIKGLG